MHTKYKTVQSFHYMILCFAYVNLIVQQHLWLPCTVSSHLIPSVSALQPVASKFFIYLLTLFMVSITSASIMYAYSSLTSVTVVALLLSALTFVFSMVQCSTHIVELENLHMHVVCVLPTLYSCLVDSSLLWTHFLFGCNGSST